MKYKVGQKVIISEDSEMWKAASEIKPPYIATIRRISSDPHSGSDMYFFKEVGWGWYEEEVEGLYIEEVLIEDRFEILDL